MIVNIRRKKTPRQVVDLGKIKVGNYFTHNEELCLMVKSDTCLKEGLYFNLFSKKLVPWNRPLMKVEVVSEVEISYSTVPL